MLHVHYETLEGNHSFYEKLLMHAEPKPQSCVGLCLLTYPATQNTEPEAVEWELALPGVMDLCLMRSSHL